MMLLSLTGELRVTRPEAKIFKVWCRLKSCPVVAGGLWKQSCAVLHFTFLFTLQLLMASRTRGLAVLRTEVMMLQVVVSLLRNAQAELCEEMTFCSVAKKF